MTTMDTNTLIAMSLTLFAWGLAIGFNWGFRRGLGKGLRATRPNERKG